MARDSNVPMTRETDTPDIRDTFDLDRFVAAQESVYGTALAELKGGRKRSHWMWFIFPQIDGLGTSPTARHFAIKSQAEARQYLQHPVLGARLLECAQATLRIEGQSALAVFGYPDDMKLKSSMTLFSSVANPNSVFDRVLEKFFKGKGDTQTIELLEGL